MKRILIFATAASVAFACSCRPEPREEDPGILAYAVCEMDIHPGSKAKAVDIEGDSAAWQGMLASFEAHGTLLGSMALKR